MHPIKRKSGWRTVGMALAGWLLGNVATAQDAPPVVPPPRPVAVDARTGAIIVPLGGSQQLQMKSKKLIRTALNERETIASVLPVATDPTRVLITGLSAGTTRISLTDIDDKVETFDLIVQLDTDYLRTLLKRSVPTANIEIIPGVNSVLILTGNVAHADDIDTILRVAGSAVPGGLNRIVNAMVVGGVNQVQLDVTVASVNRTEIRSFGFNFLLGNSVYPVASQVGNLVSLNNISTITGAGGAGGAAGGGSVIGPNLATAAPVSVANLVFGVVPALFIGVLQALRQENLAKVLAEPKLVTLSGRPASFVSGGSQAVPQVIGGVGGGSVGANFVDFGTELTFLPIVLGTGKIYLEVEPSVSSLNAAFGFTFGGVTVPGRNVQRVRTAVLMEDNQTFAIGGLIQNQISGASNKVPVVGDLPFLGPLFSTVTYTEQEQELVVLVTPHLVDPMDCNQAPTKLPGLETRSPDDFELFLEGLLEAPRGQRKVFDGKQYVPAYKNDPTAKDFPCARNGDHRGGHHGHGGDGTCESCASNEAIMNLAAGNGTVIAPQNAIPAGPMGMGMPAGLPLAPNGVLPPPMEAPLPVPGAVPAPPGSGVYGRN